MTPQKIYQKFQKIVYNIYSNSFSNKLRHEIKNFVYHKDVDFYDDLGDIDDVFKDISEELKSTTFIREVIPKDKCKVDLFRPKFADKYWVEKYTYYDFNKLIPFLSRGLSITSTYYIEVIKNNKYEGVPLMWIKNLVAYGNTLKGSDIVGAAGFTVYEYKSENGKSGKISTVEPTQFLEDVIRPKYMLDPRALSAEKFYKSLTNSDFNCYKENSSLKDLSVENELKILRGYFEDSGSPQEELDKKIFKLTKLLKSVSEEKCITCASEYVDTFLIEYDTCQLFSLVTPMSENFHSCDTGFLEACDAYLRNIITLDFIEHLMSIIELTDDRKQISSRHIRTSFIQKVESR